QGAGDGRTLLLATGELGRIGMALVGDADLLQKHLGGGDGVGLGLAQHAPRRLDDVVEDVMCGHRLKLWKTKPTRARSRLIWALSAAISAPSRRGLSLSSSPATRIWPWWGFSSRLMQRNRVLFPEPEEPRMEMTSPSRASRSTPLRTSRSP